MKTPPLLVGAALLFWGWQTGHAMLGGLAALILEGARLARWRWELSEEDYYRLSDLCAGLLLTLAFYFYISEEISQSPFFLMQWLPLVLLPVMIAQIYGPRDKISLRSFFWLFRKRIKFDPPDLGLNISYPYLAVCLLAASAVKPENSHFYLGFCGLMVWTLWSIRPRRFAVATWALLLLGVMGAAYEAQKGLHELQNLLDGRLVGWLMGGRKEMDSSESRTAIGKIGKLKLSGRIVLRLTTDGRHPPPELLRQASFITYRQGIWQGLSRDYMPVVPETNDVWNLLLEKNPVAMVTIAGYLKGGKGVLTLPFGTARIENLPSQEIESNRLGVVRVVQGPGFYNLKAWHGPGASIDSLVNNDDLVVPDQEMAVCAQLVAELQLTNKTTIEARQGLERFFQRYFNYTTYLSTAARDLAGQASPLAWFLLKSRAGHCEYFATATVLLLRAAGIPARYATGYSVQEHGRGNNYVLRERHAHAWCLVYDKEKGVWEDFDTTPPSWNAIEERNASIFQALTDFGSWVWYEFSKWRYGKAGLRQYFIWMMVPVVAVLVWRVVFNKNRVKRKAEFRETTVEGRLAGGDSEFYLIEAQLTAAGWGREPGETLANWLKRCGAAPKVSWPALQPILGLHYQYRFDPKGLTGQSREQLRSLARRWLEAYKTQKTQR